MKTKKLIGLISILLCISSCDLLENEDSSIENLDSKVEFEVVESYQTYDSVEEPKLYIKMKTEKIYGCINYSIITQHSLLNKEIDIQILGINSPSPCLTAIGPATRRIRLGILDGVYEITIKNNQFSDTYNLLITDSLIIVDGDNTNSTKSLTSFLHRYPQNSFAFLYGSVDSLKYLRNEFLNSLTSIVELKEIFFSDFAEVPYPKSSQGHYYDAPAKYFYYKDETEFERIEEVIKSFLIKYPRETHPYSISIVNWKNQKIRSWLL